MSNVNVKELATVLLPQIKPVVEELLDGQLEALAEQAKLQAAEIRELRIEFGIAQGKSK